ncbi:hypothetical protein L1987_83701 [Smallanthus sonchifolius]|uniref:Uncharacterized protein n=1 Tax=Smallanthus sonchifolius TaxID=185202 RepID=A0ACB8YDC4_9ASTR|nr:hypothetical protein L1987_83701 [Smallanthus sonchifolius]
MLPTIGLVLVLACTAIFNVFPTKADELKTYIVHLSIPEGQHFSLAHEIEEWYSSFLSKIPSRSNENPKMNYAYHHVITGFDAKMSVDQAKAIKNLSGVVSVRPEGMDAAIEDGVNVMSLSIDGPKLPFYADHVAIAAFSAIQKGIFVSFAAGNSGPADASLSNEAPWMLTVGASTIDRRIRASVLLGNKKVLDGESLYQPKDFDHNLQPLVYPGNYGDEHVQWCMKGSLDQIDVKGKVVLCDAGYAAHIEMGQAVKDAGGAAVAHVLPTSFDGYNEGVEIKK